MAVKFPVDPLKVMKAWGSPYITPEKLVAEGLTMEQTATKLILNYPGQKPYVALATPATTALLLEKGYAGVPFAHKSLWATAYETVKCWQDVGPLYVAPPPPSEPEAGPAMAMLKKKPLPYKIQKLPNTAMDGHIAASEQEMLSLPAVALSEATRLYQPTRGTDDSSRYHVVALGPINVAARWKGETLSIRCEGSALGGFASTLKSLGLKQQGSSPAYASIHLQVGNSKETARKSLGAVLLGLGVSFYTPLPDLERLIGKGQ